MTWLSPQRRGMLTAAAFLLALWAFAACFFGGDIGPWNDDYYFSLLDPATLRFARLAITNRTPDLPPTGVLSAWRPLLFTVVAWLISLSWTHFHVVHLVGAAIHLATTGLLYALLRRLGRSVHAAAAAAALFLCWAATHEAWLWPSAFGSLISALLLLLVMRGMIRFADGFGVVKARWPTVGLMMFLTACLLCFNEQASGGLAALPLVYLAIADTAEPVRRRLMRAAAASFAVCILPPIYVLLVRATAQEGLGVSAETYVPLARLWPRFLDVVADMGRTIGMRDTWYPAFAFGMHEWTRSNTRFLPWTAVLALTAVPAWRLWVSTPTHGPGAPRSEGARLVPVTLAGLVAAAGACLPVAVIEGYPAFSRVTYVLVLMLALPAACLFDVAGAAAAKLPPVAALWRRLSGAAMIALLLFGAIMTIGFQARMRRVVRNDERNARELIAQVPVPAPDTVFLPVSLRPPDFTVEEILFLHPWLRTSRIPRELELRRADVDAFRVRPQGVWEGLWSMRTFVKYAYRRNDVWCFYMNAASRGVIDADLQHLRFHWTFGTPYGVPVPGIPDAEQALVPWEKVVPITFDPEGHLQVVSTLDIVSESDPSRRLSVIIPQTRHVTNAARATLMIP